MRCRPWPTSSSSSLWWSTRESHRRYFPLFLSRLSLRAVSTCRLPSSLGEGWKWEYHRLVDEARIDCVDELMMSTSRPDQGNDGGRTRSD